MSEEIRIDKTLDVKGEVCPFPWVKAKKSLKKLNVGQVLCIVGDHGPALKNIPRNFTDEGQTVLKAEPTGEVDWEIVVRREK
jgi:TusA-related sulfurtransferase